MSQLYGILTPHWHTECVTLCFLFRYKVFNKALERVQNDNQVNILLAWWRLASFFKKLDNNASMQVTVRIGLPVTGYGQDSRNRAARQRIPHRTWVDEDGVERIEVVIMPISLFLLGARCQSDTCIALAWAPFSPLYSNTHKLIAVLQTVLVRL